MYYHEEIINGILCCKFTPKGPYRQLTPEELTDRISKLERKIAEMQQIIDANNEHPE